MKRKCKDEWRGRDGFGYYKCRLIKGHDGPHLSSFPNTGIHEVSWVSCDQFRVSFTNLKDQFHQRY